MDQCVTIGDAADDAGPGEADSDAVIAMLLGVLSDGLDHPELWPLFATILDALPGLPAAIGTWMNSERGAPVQPRLLILFVMCAAAQGHVAFARERMERLAVEDSQSAQVQGAAFYLAGLAEPDNPKFQLAGKFCPAPFTKFDVLENSAHLCCASWLQTSAGNLTTTGWEKVWNSESAQAVRASVLDGSYRHCNKTACPKIQANELVPTDEMAARSPFWREVIENRRTVLANGPERVNLAYDRTCNLSCPSCRTGRWAADESTRSRFEAMQDAQILPLLRGAKTVFVTGSGDPFASKTFRRLMTQLTADEYPALRFQIMTNGMLLTPRQWESFPALHRRVAMLKISIDAATGPTHERLRRGASWPVMLDNMGFASRLVADGQVEQLELVFTVQADNFREMGPAVDLARQIGATGIYFGRITNWGTFSDEQYRSKAVFHPSHPKFDEFIACMQDERLTDPIVLLGNMREFIRGEVGARRAFVA